MRNLIGGCMMVAACSLVLCGCSMFSEKTEEKLQGERIPVLQLQKDLEPEDVSLSATGFIAPEAWDNEFWPQSGGYSVHSMQNVVLNSGKLKKSWASSVRVKDDIPLVSSPIVIDGKVYVMDSNSNVVAFDIKNGDKLWSVDVRPEGEKESVIGGGVAFSAGALYVTSGFDEVLSLSPSDGKIIWRNKISTPARAAPTVYDGRVFIATLDNRILALNAEDGTLIWDYSAIGQSEGIVGAASPAANHDIVVPVFSSGEIYAVRVENGSVVWSDSLATVRGIGGVESLSDIVALPVIDKGVVFAVSFGGKLVAIDERTGTRIWQREIGSARTPWVAGNLVFVITNDNKMVAIGRDSGVISWVTDMDKFTDEPSKSWTAPILAGNRIITIDEEGQAVELAPDSGELLRSWDVGGKVSLDPVVAGGVLYVLQDNGRLVAYK